MREPSLIIIDEAHHSLAPSYRLLWEAFPEVKKLGVTATPYRLKREAFTGLYDNLICSWSVRRFIGEGYLADYDYLVIRPDSEMKARIESLKKRGADGDYQVKEMGGVLDNRPCLEQLYSSLNKHAKGLRGIVYAISIEHAEHIAEYYREFGIRAVAVSAKTQKKDRERMVDDFRKGLIDCIVNVDIFSEGFDCPDVQYIQMARPTLSLSKYLQQVGRGLRPNRDGSHTVILDCVGMYYMFGLPNEDRDWEGYFRNTTSTLFGNENYDNSHSKLAAYAIHDNYRIVGDSEQKNITIGHNFEMMVVHERTKERTLGADISFMSIGSGDLKGLFKNGKRIGSAEFRHHGEFVDGVVKTQNDLQGESVFLNYQGKQVASCSGISELLNDGYILTHDEYGFVSYFDTKMQTRLKCLPHIYNIGDGEFVEEEDGMHLRIKPYCHISFDKKLICIKNGFCMATNSLGNQYIVYDKGWQVLRVLEEDIDGSFVCTKDGYKNTLFLGKDGMITPISMKGHEKLFKKWNGELKKEFAGTEKDYQHRFVSNQWEQEVYSDKGKYGWKCNGEIVCNAQFIAIKKIFTEHNCALVSFDGNTFILVDLTGNILYDKHPITNVDYPTLFIKAEIEGKSLVGKVNIENGKYMLAPVNWQTNINVPKNCNNLYIIDDFQFRQRMSMNGYSVMLSPDVDGSNLPIINMDGIVVKNGILIAEDTRKTPYKTIIAFTSEPKRFYRVTETLENGNKILKDISSEERYIYNPQKALFCNS